MYDEEMLRQAKTNPSVRNDLLVQNKKFILKSAYYTLNRYISESDEEWSVALIAYNEAIDSWEKDRGSSFQSFAQLVIKRRLLNFLRADARFKNELMTDPIILEGNPHGEEEPTAFQREVQDAVSRQSQNDRRQCLSDEIAALEEVLEWYPIDFFDLDKVSPKAGKTRDACGLLIAKIWRNPELYQKMRESKNLPVKELLSYTKIHKKIPERHRKFIIASAEILHGDYPILQEYLRYIKEF